MKKYQIIIVCCCIALAELVRLPAARADTVKFQTTSREMVRELTRPGVRYRSLAPPRTRTIVVAATVDNQMAEQTVIVAEDQDTPRLNLKVEFDRDSSRVRPSAYGLLREVGKALDSVELRDAAFLINGHTDADGTEAYNRRLSYRRAAAVKSFLVSTLGIAEARLTIRGFGESSPLLPNTGPVNKQINRRVEFEIDR